MTERVVRTGSGVRVISTGPPGPPGKQGPPGPPGSGFGTGYQTIDLSNLTKYTLTDMLSGAAQLTEVDVKYIAGEPVSGILALRFDLSELGGGAPVDMTQTIWFERNLIRPDEVLVEYSGQNDPEQPYFTGRGITTWPISVMEMFGMALQPINYFAADPTQEGHVATKRYVDDLVGPSGGSAVEVRNAVKYGRNLGGRWALVGGPGHYETPDVGPLDQGGIIAYFRVKPMSGDPGRTQGDRHFWEIITQFRNADGVTFDQDNLEIAVYMCLARLGLFEEECLISSPFPVPGGEYADGRLYTEQQIGFFPDSTVVGSGLDFTLGDAMEVRFEYVYDRGDGRWIKTFWVRTDAASYVTPSDLYEWRERGDYLSPDDLDMLHVGTGEDVYWKKVLSITGPEGQIGSIADAGLPFHIGRNGGVMGVEYAQLRHRDTFELILDFQAKDIDPVTGVATSLLIPGQTFTPYTSDGGDPTPLPVIDDTPAGMWKTEQRLRALEP